MHLRIITAMLALGLAATAAHAINLQFLSQTPYAQFPPADKKTMKATILRALDETADGATLDWKNEASGASGSISPQRSFERDGRNCRELRIQNTFRTRTGEGLHTFCRDSAGKWQLAR
jgi:surface antigen